ncbi:P1 family peptidase [Mesorhizobium sp. GR13]|uniref:DmpA family aminopeptidase n=1 Tax=Mesorhizobium sp. GR13 TaxID=2562308 RepID=UPI0010C0D090|nr:P1 family peptidase [Mesorhizobium sp. GR13]
MSRGARKLGWKMPGTTGPGNAITDVAGVLVGSTTLLEQQGRVRTGVTAILPTGYDRRAQVVHAGIHVLNGNGEMTGAHWIRDAGYFLGPICITNTHSVGIAHHAAVKWMISQYEQVFRDEHIWAMPVIAETYDGVLNDINGQHVREEHVLAALNSANSGPVAEGNAGGGTGMICYEFKGGTGTSSRKVKLGGKDYTVGVLVQANHGRREWLTILGEPIGNQMTDDRLFERERGSIIVIIATDAPLRPDQLDRLARRGAIGISRSGTPGGNSSGDIFLAFSTANRRPLPQLDEPLQSFAHLNDEILDDIYQATVEATDEAIINAMLAAQDMTTLKPAGKVCRAIDGAAVTEILRAAGKAA